MTRSFDGTPQADQEYRNQVKKAAVASTIGTAIEWYDFFLYGTMAALVFPQLFFPKSDPYVGVLQSFTTFALGFVARPVGAAIFGHYGDRIGRKATLIITLLLMGVSSTIIGLLPTYESIGLWAPVLLVILRLCQGLGVGGEWGGSVLLSMEWGHKGKRGLMASWPQMGVPLGLLLSSGLTTLFISLTGSSFNTWGWRIPFILSIVLVGIGLFIRLRVLESPLFSRIIEEKQVARQPVMEVIKKNPKEIVLSAFCRLAENAPFYVFVTFVISYGTSKLQMDRGLFVNATLYAAIASVFAVPFFGYLSDKIGRKRMYMLGILAVLLWAFPYYGLLNTKESSLIVLAVVLSLVFHGMMYGPQAALIAESFPTRLRYSGSSLGYQLTSIIGGGPAPLICTWLLHTYGSSTALSIYLIVLAVLSFIATAMLKDRTHVNLAEEHKEFTTA